MGQMHKLLEKNQSLDLLASQSRAEGEKQLALQAKSQENQRLRLRDELELREAELTRLQARLEQMQFSIDQVLNRQLTENQALLNQLNWLSGTIAHDFRAPLRAIDANSFFLEDDLGDSGPPDAKRSLSEIRRNGKRMGVLIDGLLDYLRVGISPLNLQDMDVGDLIRQVVAQEFSLAPVVVETDLHLSIKGDKEFLFRLFKELLDNAIKFSAEVPQPNIRVQSVGRYGIEIVDNGVGFSETYRDQLFKLFHRLHGNDEYPGEGIGLCIAQRIAQRHGGNLQLNRTANQTIAFVELGDMTQPNLANNSSNPGNAP